MVTDSLGTHCGDFDPFRILQHLSFTTPYICFTGEPLQEMETDNVRSLLVLQNNQYLTSFKGYCRYYILIAIILIPAYPVLEAMILELFL